MSTALSERLIKSLQKHLDNKRDFEGRSPLDILISEILAHSELHGDWNNALIKVIRRVDSGSGHWWQAIEFFVAMTKLTSSKLADTLEDVLARKKSPDALGRASVYALLAECNRPVSASLLAGDDDLRRNAPLLWLDLMLPLIPEQLQKQEIVLELVKCGDLSIADLAIRLDDMRSVGGANLGKWLKQIGEAFPEERRAQYAALLAESGFTVSPNIIHQQHSLPTDRHIIDISAYRDKIKTGSQTYIEYENA